MEIECLLIGLFAGAMAMGFLGVTSNWAAWRNGVVDGFGYAVEPRNPGYQKAGNHLRKVMDHRWGDLLKNISYRQFKGTDDLSEIIKKTGELLRDKPQDDHSQAPSPVLWSRADSFTSPGESGAVTGFAPLPGDGGPVE